MKESNATPITDPAQRAILALAASRGEVALAGNKEFYAFIRHQDGMWLRTDGDPLAQQDEETYQIDGAAVLRALFWRAREMRGLYGPDDGSLDWPGVLDWLRESHI